MKIRFIRAEQKSVVGGESASKHFQYAALLWNFRRGEHPITCSAKSGLYLSHTGNEGMYSIADSNRKRQRREQWIVCSIAPLTA